MDAWETADLIAQQQASGAAYSQFHRVATMSLGVYSLAAGAEDTQQPHTEDEVYLVLSGAATVHVAGEDRPVREGSVIFVAANDEHRFHSITQDLSLLVFFAPPLFANRSALP